MGKKEILEGILGKCEETTSFLGYHFWRWKITHRKAINILMKNGFGQALNINYIWKDDNHDFCIYKKGGSHKNVFLFEAE